MKVEITKAQLTALMQIVNDVEGMIGCADSDDSGFNWDVKTSKRVNLIDKFLNKNGFKRGFGS